MPTVKKHPLAEILSKKLFGIENVPKKEISMMVYRAIKAAVKYHDAKMENETYIELGTEENDLGYIPSKKEP